MTKPQTPLPPPPPNSKASYSAPVGGEAAGSEFKDTWALNDIDIAWPDLIEANCPEDEIVLGAFYGCTSPCVATEVEGREWTGIYISAFVKARLNREIGLSTFNICINRTDMLQRTDVVPLKKYNHPDSRKFLYGEQSWNCNGRKEHFKPQHLPVGHIIPRSNGRNDCFDKPQLTKGSRAGISY